MSMRVCAQPGCAELITSNARDGRCDQHRRARDKARGTRQQRGYDRNHERVRAAYQRRIEGDEQFICWRCEQPIDPLEPWDLDHTDDRRGYRGPTHPACNRGHRVPLDISPDA